VRSFATDSFAQSQTHEHEGAVHAPAVWASDSARWPPSAVRHMVAAGRCEESRGARVGSLTLHAPAALAMMWWLPLQAPYHWLQLPVGASVLALGASTVPNCALAALYDSE